MRTGRTGITELKVEKIRRLREGINAVSKKLQRRTKTGPDAYRHLENARWLLRDAETSPRFRAIRLVDKGFEELKLALEVPPRVQQQVEPDVAAVQESESSDEQSQRDQDDLGQSDGDQPQER